MSAYKRVQQWATFAQTWHLYDVKWQDPFISAKIIQKYLRGLHKPIYSPTNQCGDHVVVMNSQDIALRGDEWRKRVYFHHTGFHGGASWTLAWELHKRDPTMIMRKAVYSSMKGNLQRRYTMERLHIFHNDKIPEDIMGNITHQISVPFLVPRRLDSYTAEEVEKFPKVIDYPENYVIPPPR